MAVNPRHRFSLPLKNDDYTLWDLGAAYPIDPKDFLSQGKSTPFEGRLVQGKCLLTVAGGKTAFSL